MWSVLIFVIIYLKVKCFLYFIFRRELPTLLHFIKKLSNAGTHTANFIVTKTTVVLSVLTFFGWRRLSRNGRGPAV